MKQNGLTRRDLLRLASTGTIVAGAVPGRARRLWPSTMESHREGFSEGPAGRNLEAQAEDQPSSLAGIGNSKG